VPFREDFDGALSYFVATNGVCSEDKGFAIKGWTKVRWENHKIVTNGSTGTAMGNYYFTTPEGEDVKVEYTFGYFLDSEGNVRINLHHSSVPFSAPGQQVTEEMVVTAQKAWSDGVVAIGQTKANGGDYEEAARKHIRKHYGYGKAEVLFKPTLAAAVPFRADFDGALSYFVATNGVCSEDKGFAIKGWTKVRWENHKIVTHGSTATAMGNYYFTTPEGEDVEVEYTFGYFLDSEGNLLINLHHSSVPFSAGEEEEKQEEKQLQDA